MFFVWERRVDRKHAGQVKVHCPMCRVPESVHQAAAYAAAVSFVALAVVTVWVGLGIRRRFALHVDRGGFTKALEKLRGSEVSKGAASR